MKIGITGNQNFTQSAVLKELIWKLSNKFGNELEIISRGNNFGVDKLVKNICNINGIEYTEFIPRHNSWNPNCVEKKYLFNQRYNPKYFYINDNNFIKYCDYIFLYVNKKQDNTFINNINKILKDKNNIAIIYI